MGERGEDRGGEVLPHLVTPCEGEHTVMSSVDSNIGLVEEGQLTNRKRE